MSEDRISRRKFFGNIAIGGAATVGAAYMLSACKGRGKHAAALSCMDTKGLSKIAIQTRVAEKYTDHSPKPNERCLNCQQYTQPKVAGNCGGCKILKGPINAKGWCKLWSKKKA